MQAKTFKFQKETFRVENVGLIALSKATIEPRITYRAENGEVIKAFLPVSVARLMRIKLHNVTKFIEDYPCCLAFVGDRIVAMDVAVGKDLKMYQEFGEWISMLDKRQSLIDQLDDSWMWDGQYAYRCVGEVRQIGDSNLGTIECRAFNMYRLSEEKTDVIEHLSAMCYRNPVTGEWVKTSPVTRNSGGFIQVTGDVSKFNRNDQFIDSSEGLEKLDQLVFVNIRFVNYASRALSARFGFESIEPLGLPLLMIEHRTFNVGGLDLSVQMSSPAPIRFTHAVAWLIGLFTKVETLEDMIAIKQAFKMLLTKGNTNEQMMGVEKKAVDTKGVIQQLRDKMESAAIVNFDD